MGNNKSCVNTDYGNALVGQEAIALVNDDQDVCWRIGIPPNL